MDGREDTEGSEEEDDYFETDTNAYFETDANEISSLEQDPPRERFASSALDERARFAAISPLVNSFHRQKGRRRAKVHSSAFNSSAPLLLGFVGVMISDFQWIGAEPIYLACVLIVSSLLVAVGLVPLSPTDLIIDETLQEITFCTSQVVHMAVVVLVAVSVVLGYGLHFLAYYIAAAPLVYYLGGLALHSMSKKHAVPSFSVSVAIYLLLFQLARATNLLCIASGKFGKSTVISSGILPTTPASSAQMLVAGSILLFGVATSSILCWLLSKEDVRWRNLFRTHNDGNTAVLMQQLYTFVAFSGLAMLSKLIKADTESVDAVGFVAGSILFVSTVLVWKNRSLLGNWVTQWIDGRFKHNEGALVAEMLDLNFVRQGQQVYEMSVAPTSFKFVRC
jgi:hypothetical protein